MSLARAALDFNRISDETALRSVSFLSTHEFLRVHSLDLDRILLWSLLLYLLLDSDQSRIDLFWLRVPLGLMVLFFHYNAKDSHWVYGGCILPMDGCLKFWWMTFITSRVDLDVWIFWGFGVSSLRSIELFIGFSVWSYEVWGLDLANLSFEAPRNFELWLVGVLRSFCSYMMIRSLDHMFFVVSEPLSFWGFKVSKSSISIAIFLRLLILRVLSARASRVSGLSFELGRNR